MQYERFVIAYDIAKTSRRNKVAKYLEGKGERVNFSVFECEIKKGQLHELREKVKSMIKKSEDIVIYYPLCLDCRSAVISDGKPMERNLEKPLLSV